MVQAMTSDEVSALIGRLAPGAQIRSVLDTIQYRIGGKAFATVGWPAEGWAVVKLSLREQKHFLSRSDVICSEPGRRRHSGVTLVKLKGVDEALMVELLAAAWREAYRRAEPTQVSAPVVAASRFG